MSSYGTEAVVIKAKDFGEADRILTLYTNLKGKINAIAKGVKRVESRKSGSLDLLSRSSLFLAEGRNLDIILEAQSINPHRSLSEDLEKSSLALKIAEIIDQFAPEHQINKAIYKLLTEALDYLNRAKNEEANKILYTFELKFLGLAGFRPQLVVCVSCMRILSQTNNRFSPNLGGVLCSSCARLDSAGRPISAEAIKIMRFLQDESWEQVERLSYPGIIDREVDQQIDHYLEYLLEKDLKSARFVERVNGLPK